jgi:hypothetical protein
MGSLFQIACSWILKWIKSIGRIKAGQQNCRNIRPPWFFSMYDSHTLCVTFLGIFSFTFCISSMHVCKTMGLWENSKGQVKTFHSKKSFQWQLCCTYINFAVVLSVLLPFLLLYFVRWMDIFTDKSASFKDARPSNPFFIKVFAKLFESQKPMWN